MACCKIQNYLVREIYKGAQVVLDVYVVKVINEYVVVYGLAVYDDKTHPKLIYGACRSVLEMQNLVSFLKLETFPVQFHNEIQVPILNANCKFDPQKSTKILSAITDFKCLSRESNDKVREKALDIIEKFTRNEAGNEPLIVLKCELSLEFSKMLPINVDFLDSEQISLEGEEQGKELENLTYILFEDLFQYGTFHSPKRDDTKGLLEICDVLAVSRINPLENEGVFVVQNKVTLTDGKDRTLKKKGKSIESNIKKAIRQSIGAIRKIKKGIQVYKSDGTRIEADPPEIEKLIEPLELKDRAQNVGFGIIVISDMHESVNWVSVLLKLVEAYEKTGYLHFVLDLSEICKLIENSNGKPAILEFYLIERWKSYYKEKTAMIRQRLVYPS